VFQKVSSLLEELWYNILEKIIFPL